MTNRLLRKVISGIAAFSVIVSLIPVQNVYAATGYKGLNGTEVIQFPHTHWFSEKYGGHKAAFHLGNLEYSYKMCTNPIRYSNGRVKDCDELKCYVSRNNSSKYREISKASFDKAYKIYRNAIVHNGGVYKWGKYSPSKLNYYYVDGVTYIKTKVKGIYSYSTCYEQEYTSTYDVNNDAGFFLNYEIRVSASKNMKKAAFFKTDDANGNEIESFNKSKMKFKKNKAYYVQVRPVIRYKVVKIYPNGTYGGCVPNAKNRKSIKKAKTRIARGPWSKAVKLNAKYLDIY